MDARKLSTSSDKFIASLYKVIADVSFGDSTGYAFTANQIDELKGIAWEEVKARQLNLSSFQTPQEAYASTVMQFGTRRMAGDQINPAQINPQLGWGTVLDPQMHTHSNIPVLCGPSEATAVYANGGLPANIIDKKTRAMVMHGVTFKAHNDTFWTADKIEMLEEAAEETGLNAYVADGICDAFLQGGSVVYPVFNRDDPLAMVRHIDDLQLEKGCINRWVETDRWNTTIVPNFIVTAADYLHPETLLIPMGNVEVHTSRIAMLKPKSLPYWAALYNIGWCPSDLNGWLRAYYAYEITQMSVPVMAQQMSLILYRMPVDGLNATIGPANVKKLMDINQENMAKWNSLNPQAVNMVGEVEVVNRTYSGFENFIGAVKSELAAQCGIPEPSLWHTPNKGFSDNMTESLLKQSETLQLAKQAVERYALPIRDCLIAHVWGNRSKEYASRRTLKLLFDKPVISTEKDMAEVGARFAASVNSFVQAGVSPDVAIELSKPFFPSIRVTDAMITAAKKSYDEQLERGATPGKGGAMGGAGAAKSQGVNTGKGTVGGKA